MAPRRAQPPRRWQQLLAMLLPVLLMACVPVEAAGAPPTTSDGAPPGAFFFESFGPGWMDRWHYSSGKKYKGVFATVQPPGYQDTAIQMPQGNVHYGIAAALPSPLDPSEGLVVQYEVKFAQGHTCGGAYLKLLSQPPADAAAGGKGGARPLELQRLRAKTPFTVMFGPDRCGPDSRVHVIINALNPVTQEVVEHHLMSAPLPKGDNLTHVYTLVLSPDHRYKVLIDGVDKASGLLAAASFSPPLQPPEAVPDPDHLKPDDWVEEEMMDDPAAVKPEGWDDRKLVQDPRAKMPEGWLEGQPARIPDPGATRPEGWEDTRDGEWVRPTVPNPACAGAPGCGPWSPPLVANPHYRGPWIPPQVKNPDYKGEWKQRTVPNPSFYKADAPLAQLAPVAAVAFELWTTEAGYTFDSVLVGRGEEGLDAAAAHMRNVWRHRYRFEYNAAMEEAMEGNRPPGWRHAAANALLDLFGWPPLAPFKPAARPLLRRLQQTPELAWGVATAAAASVVGAAALSLRVLLQKKASAAAADGEGSDPGSDDAREHDRFVRELREARQAAKREAAAADAAAAAADSDGEDEDEDEGEGGGEGSAADSRKRGSGAGGGGGGGSQGGPSSRATRRSARRA